MEIYNPLSNKWRQWLEIPGERQDYGAGVMDKKLFILGGYSDSYLNDCMYLDLETKVWTSVSRMKIPRNDLGVAVVKGQLYAVGGRNDAKFNSVERFE